MSLHDKIAAMRALMERAKANARPYQTDDDDELDRAAISALPALLDIAEAAVDVLMYRDGKLIGLSAALKKLEELQ